MRVRPSVSFTVCVLIWGGSWLAIRAAVRDADPVGIAALRTLLAFALLFPFAHAYVRPRPDVRGILTAMAIGTVFIGANFALVFWSAPRLTVGFAAIAYSTTPLQAALLAPLLATDSRPRPRDFVAFVLGILGILVAFAGPGTFQAVARVAAAAVLLGATTSALGTVLARRWNKVHPVWLNVYANLAGFLVLILYYALAGEGALVPQSGLGWAGFAYMLLGGSVLAMLLYFDLVRTWDATRATLTTLLTPFVALVLGFLVAHEPVRPTDVAGAVLVVVACLIALRRGPAPTTGRGAPAQRPDAPAPSAPTSATIPKG